MDRTALLEKNREENTAEWGIGYPSISVVGGRFCNPYPVELTVKREVETLKRDRYDVVDSSGNLLLRVDGSLWDFRRKRLMRDSSGLPILNFRSEPFSLKYKWDVYKGESEANQNLLFCAQESNYFSLKTSLNIFGAHNSKDNASDVEASGGFVDHSFKVFKSNLLLAEVIHDYSWRKVWKGNYSFKVRVKPEVDYAFIVALVVIMDDINNLR